MGRIAPSPRRTLETLIAGLERREAVEASRPWPIHGQPVGRYDEAWYRRACDEDAAHSIFCVRRFLMEREDGDFVVAAFRTLAGYEPDRSTWHYHVTRLASGRCTRDGLLRDLQQAHGSRHRRVVLFDKAQLRGFVEASDIGLQDIVKLLPALIRRQARRRMAMVLSWVSRRARFR